MRICRLSKPILRGQLIGPAAVTARALGVFQHQLADVIERMTRRSLFQPQLELPAGVTGPRPARTITIRKPNTYHP
jgi:hypothetical protein